MAYAAALDIGTTIISGSLLDLESGVVKKRFSCLNNQVSYGHDIISRIHFALNKKNGFHRLNKSIISSIDFVLENLAGDIELNFILAVGNSVMHHFIFSMPLDSFVRPPYRLYKTEGMEMQASELGLKNFPKARFRMLPNIGSFIGSDAVAVILVVGLYKSEDCILAVDIGTNGEIILGSKEGISVCSTAAGPAFEGWHISCGMRAQEGAIESADEKDGKIRLGVIGGAEPEGISGSGLIDLMGILLKRGEIDRTGKLKNKEFVVYEGSKKIVLTQSDVRETQLAKAAFSVGIKFLRERKEKPISRVCITGTFGNYLNKENARSIGLIPSDLKSDKIEFLNDGALTGAEMVLSNPDLEKDINDILDKAEHVPLTANRNFQSDFAAAMHF